MPKINTFFFTVLSLVHTIPSALQHKQPKLTFFLVHMTPN